MENNVDLKTAQDSFNKYMETKDIAHLDVFKEVFDYSNRGNFCNNAVLVSDTGELLKDLHRENENSAFKIDDEAIGILVQKED